MRSLRVTIVMLLSVVSGMLHVEITETGTEGNIAVILCPYSKVYESYTKYFCKGLYKDCETLLKSNGKDFWTSKDRIIMNDDTEQKKLVVTIRDLRMEDAGDYGCGIETTGRDPFTLVHLKVIKAPKPPKRTQSNPTRSSPPPPTKNNESHAPTISTNKTAQVKNRQYVTNMQRCTQQQETGQGHKLNLIYSSHFFCINEHAGQVSSTSLSKSYSTFRALQLEFSPTLSVQLISPPFSPSYTGCWSRPV
ncbi:CMRF35-like molecule 5 isoform X2 [Pygocentrus nattereri]|uniref:CMRF35-like molecule 5 isoform X2 n=1 Tax=Pygocentrus nattereri TaxID=42514 RepID=UPI0018910D16|nr:CMRF35-like molecule 5 isoform X2 [Pygocentrus nattereri]